MNATKFFLSNLYLGVAFSAVALASRAFRYFEYKGYYAADWLSIPRDLMVCSEHFLAGVGFPALLVAFSWLCWGFGRTRIDAVASRKLQLVDDYAAVGWMFAQTAGYLAYAAYWEFAPHEAIGPATGKLANQFVFDAFGVALYLAIMAGKRAFALTRELGREVCVPGFRIGAINGTARGATVADLERYHSLYPRLGLFISMLDDGSGETVPRLVFVWDGEEIFNPLCGSSPWAHVDPAAEYGISLADAQAIVRINGC
ncbi:hypothetical protein [Cupriavidus sp. L7L]|uniref:hypothetical protein n=1 Tax=Cupriavidus sp. L7L TaxID=2546443 RepID=UPI001056D038|nr:hypothetical protein [Cupriavidus sp. L7L]TDF62891.1 hypothetical protein E1J61_26930 [Cupriavidus sp. L7L]